MYEIKQRNVPMNVNTNIQGTSQGREIKARRRATNGANLSLFSSGMPNLSSKLGQIGPKWDKFDTFQISFQTEYCGSI